MKERPIVIVGAGMGGLALALRLAHRGENVVVLEKTDQVGGRNREVSVHECTFDAGPTLLMMLDPFRKLYADVDERFETQLNLHRCDPSYRVFYSDGIRLEGSPDRATMRATLARLFGEREAQGYERLLNDLKGLYEDAIPNFVRKNFDRPTDFFGARQLGMVLKHRMLANLAKRMEHYFADPRLRMLFSFQTMYLGLSPYEAPWVYSVLTYMEYGEGIYYPQGGIAELARNMQKLAEQRGATFRLNSPVKEVRGEEVILATGETIQARSVVMNADLPYSEKELLKAPSKKKRSYSCSTFMMYLDYKGTLPDLLHHNVFFGKNFFENLDQVFNQKVLPEEPAFYAAISARSDPRKAPNGHENLYLLVPCPNLDRPWTEADGLALQERVFKRLACEVGFEPSQVVGQTQFTPFDWSNELNLDKGAAFGLSHHFLQSAFFRPNNRKAPGTYFVGASTVPGNGMPMVLISAELAEERLMRDGLIRPR